MGILINLFKIASSINLEWLFNVVVDFVVILTQLLKNIQKVIQT